MKNFILLLALGVALTAKAGTVGDLLVKISLDQATHQVLNSGNHRVLGAETVIINGREVHVIKVLTPDGRIRFFRIDAETGAILG